MRFRPHEQTPCKHSPSECPQSEPSWKSHAWSLAEFSFGVTSLWFKWKTCVTLKFISIKYKTKQNHLVPARPSLLNISKSSPSLFYPPLPLSPAIRKQSFLPRPPPPSAASGTLGTECEARRLNARWLLQIWWRMMGVAGGRGFNWRCLSAGSAGREKWNTRGSQWLPVAQRVAQAVT